MNLKYYLIPALLFFIACDKTDEPMTDDEYLIAGNFSIVENKLFLKYNCIGPNTEAENEDGFITYNLDFFSDYFILTPTSEPICIEGCSLKYQKKT